MAISAEQWVLEGVTATDGNHRLLTGGHDLRGAKPAIFRFTDPIRFGLNFIAKIKKTLLHARSYFLTARKSSANGPRSSSIPSRPMIAQW